MLSKLKDKDSVARQKGDAFIHAFSTRVQNRLLDGGDSKHMDMMMQVRWAAGLRAGGLRAGAVGWCLRGGWGWH